MIKVTHVHGKGAKELAVAINTCGDALLQDNREVKDVKIFTSGAGQWNAFILYEVKEEKYSP